MSKRVSLAPVKFGLKAKAATRPPKGAGASRVWYENLTPPGAPPVVRMRITTPITPRAVRAQLIEMAAEIPDAKRQDFIRRRLTRLDRKMSDEAAGALEDYATAENEFTRAKTSTYDAILVDGGGRASPDRIAPRIGLLRRHAMVKKRLAATEVSILRVFSAQMEGAMDAPDYARAGQMFGLAAKGDEVGAESAWFVLLARMGNLLLNLHAADRGLLKIQTGEA